MSNNRLDAYLKGSDENGGEVYFDDLSSLCNNLSACLRATEVAITEEARAKARYSLSKLERGSINLSITPGGATELGDIATETIQTFNRTVAALQEGRAVDAKLGVAVLEAYRKLADYFLRRKSDLSLSGIDITSRFVANIDDLLGIKISSEGSFKGCIEKLNIHNKNECVLFSPILDKGISCTFDTKLFQQVHMAVGKNATISGKLSFSGHSATPDHIHINSVEIHPDDSELPTLGSLRGMLDDMATNGMSSLEFLNSVRNGAK